MCYDHDGNIISVEPDSDNPEDQCFGNTKGRAARAEYPSGS